MKPAAPTPTGESALLAFFRLEAAGGLLLMAAAALALLAANSPLAGAYQSFLLLPVSLELGPLALDKPLLLWINDGLMAVFFLLVGLELKREAREGHLASLRQASLAGWAALGGMIVPALLFLWLNAHDPVARQGWAIPMATDIAFALGVLSLLGSRVPAGLKAFLLSVAIFDDLGAVVVIALFYTAELSALALGLAALCLLGLAALNRYDVRTPLPYLLLGALLWLAVLKSGVHATLAGVALALFIPLGSKDRPEAAPLRRLEHALHPWVAFGVLPLFAFANAGLDLRGFSLSQLGHPVPLGIVAGLFLGKQAGVWFFSFLAVRLGLAALPGGVTWRALYGVAVLCGIGFTMSLFIASLAFEQGEAGFFGLERLGILLGSLLSGLAGYALLRGLLPPKDRSAPV
ncbi:MAG: Na+/H+ antiporter NhaA [Candidatus Delongbacteria bacterium]